MARRLIRPHTAAMFKTWAGALVAPILWFVQQEAIFWPLPDPCGRLSWTTLAISAACVILVVAATFVSARTIRTDRSEPAHKAGHLLAFGLTVIMPLLFLVPMGWQALGGLFYSGCEQ
jgi:ABC-type amino acid transport system permease subunit